MDWSKAKSILIIALIIANILIASAYVGELREEQQARDAAALSAAEYAASCGVYVYCKVPAKDVKLPVLFVSFSDSAEAAELSYKGCPVELTGEGYGVPVSFSTGDAEGHVESASSALVSFISGLDDAPVNGEPLCISDISLVYWINRSSFSPSVAEDTAVPAWKFTTNGGVFYESAFSD